MMNPAQRNRARGVSACGKSTMRALRQVATGISGAAGMDRLGCLAGRTVLGYGKLRWTDISVVSHLEIVAR